MEMEEDIDRDSLTEEEAQVLDKYLDVKAKVAELGDLLIENFHKRLKKENPYALHSNGSDNPSIEVSDRMDEIMGEIRATEGISTENADDVLWDTVPPDEDSVKAVEELVKRGDLHQSWIASVKAMEE